MSILKRDKTEKGKGLSPTFQIRITPELKAQFEAVASDAGMTLGNWLKTLGRKELERLGITPKS
ncbi:hypothetical protein [Xenorhabdus sp. BG5]|uniref:hypothetical protein n=1 Tax=Xenorhabdus sp. BG5 TaxID=2782014 RepID=UPI001882E7C8|nr:hypothetical protein [Xenorhabdus sp. BG5]MBE8597007.1 hypothetical protein [Xenorhabdus sp. BG5]